VNDDKMGCLEVLGLFIGVAIVVALTCWACTAGLPEWLESYLLE
jgi:hypothetical protein